MGSFLEFSGQPLTEFWRHILSGCQVSTGDSSQRCPELDSWQLQPLATSFIGIPIVLRYLTAFMLTSVKRRPALWPMMDSAIQCMQYRWALDRTGDLIMTSYNIWLPECWLLWHHANQFYIMLFSYISWYLLYVIVVPWASRAYGICALSVVICIPEGENTYITTRRLQTHTPHTPAEAHGTADLYHDSIN